MHTGLGALSYAAEFVERVDTSSVQEEKGSSGGTMSSDDDVELTVRGDNASSDDDDTIELSPQVTVRDSVVGYTEPSAIATSSYLSRSVRWSLVPRFLLLNILCFITLRRCGRL